jgi:hypothetical protein
MSYHVFINDDLEYLGSVEHKMDAIQLYNDMANGHVEATPRYLWETYRAAGQYHKAPPSTFDPDSDDGEWLANIFVWEEA